MNAQCGYDLDAVFVDITFHSEKEESTALEAESEWIWILQHYSGNPTAQRAVRGVKFAFRGVHHIFLNKLC